MREHALPGDCSSSQGGEGGCGGNRTNDVGWGDDLPSAEVCVAAERGLDGCEHERHGKGGAAAHNLL